MNPIKNLKPNLKEKSFRKFSFKTKKIRSILEPEEIQTHVYTVGKEMDMKNLRDWFKLIYEVVFGETNDQEWIFHKFWT